MNNQNNKEKAATDSFMKKGHQSIMETLNKGMETVGENKKSKKMNYTAKEAITFQQLKDFVNSLEEWQLECPVDVMGDERDFHIDDARVFDEDYYRNEEGIELVSACDDDISQYEIIKKGTPYLSIDGLKQVES